MVASSIERKNPNMNSEEEDDSVPTLDCNLIPVILCVWNSLISIHKFARKHFKPSSINPNMIIDSLPTSRNPNMIIDSLPTLPFDLVTEILSRLPVKILVQFRCVCKSWNSLISDHDFSRKHFKLSAMHNLHFISDHHLCRPVLKSYPLQSVFTDLTTNFTQLGFPSISPYRHDTQYNYIVGSCDGILCLASFIACSSVVLWNPSIRKFKELPPFENPLPPKLVAMYGFGYDHVSHNYKVVVLYNCLIDVNITRIKVYTLSTNSWSNTRTLPFPFHSMEYLYSPNNRIYVSGTINWLACTKWHHPLFIVSFDLGEESYRKICPPEHGVKHPWGPKLCVLKDCLCMVCYHDVWVMKEYGVKESWTKLFELSNLLGKCVPPSYLTSALYIFEDDQVLLEETWKKKLIIYDFKNDTFKLSAMFETLPAICTESLISPCS